VFCCVGGGGLIAGVAAYIKRLRPNTKIIGVEAADADAMDRSLKAGKRVRLESVGLFADGAAVKYVGQETFRLCQEYVDEMVLVDTDAICAAIKDVFEDTRSILEPAGALAVAGAKAWAKQHGAQGKTLVAAASGASPLAQPCPQIDTTNITGTGKNRRNVIDGLSVGRSGSCAARWKESTHHGRKSSMAADKSAVLGQG